MGCLGSRMPTMRFYYMYEEVRGQLGLSNLIRVAWELFVSCHGDYLFVG